MTAKQSEILFLWDGENWNPNGDILNENAPRYDEVASKALVSDVRIKRTIRDYLDRNGYEIFVKEVECEGGGVVDGKTRVEQLVGGNAKNKDVVNLLIERCIDVRAFGGVFPVEKKSFNLTGPVQFKMSKSVNDAEIVFVKGTGAFASEKCKENKTFREEYILPYALFATYGVSSEYLAQKSRLSEEDMEAVLRGLWRGTKNLISRSKFGQLPRFLLRVVYKEPGEYIGALDKLIDLVTDKVNTAEIRSIDEYSIDISRLADKLEANRDKIERVEYVHDEELKIAPIPEWWQRVEAL
jgi:CRISPR-associated protein Csh2